MAIYTLNRFDQWVATGLYEPSAFEGQFVVKCKINGVIKKQAVRQITDTDQYCIVGQGGNIYLLENYSPFDKYYLWCRGKPSADIMTGRSIFEFKGNIVQTIKISNTSYDQAVDKYYYTDSGGAKTYISSFRFNPIGIPIELKMPYSPFLFDPMLLEAGIVVPQRAQEELFFPGEMVMIYNNKGIEVYNLEAQTFVDSNGSGAIQEFGYLHSMTTWQAAFPICVSGSKVDWTQSLDLQDAKLYEELIVPAQDGAYIYNNQRVDYVTLSISRAEVYGNPVFVPVKKPLPLRLKQLGLSPVTIPSITVAEIQANSNSSLSEIKSALAAIEEAKQIAINSANSAADSAKSSYAAAQSSSTTASTIDSIIAAKLESEKAQLTSNVKRVMIIGTLMLTLGVVLIIYAIYVTYPKSSKKVFPGSAINWVE